MFCPKCGFKNNDGAEYCQGCGVKLPNERVVHKAEVINGTTNEHQRVETAKSSNDWCCCFVVLAIVCAVAAVLIF